MKIRYRYVIMIETVIIFILFALLVYEYKKPVPGYYDDRGNIKLLSPKIYAGILQPKSFLIYNWQPLMDSFNEFIAKENLSVSLYVLNLRDSSSAGINPNKQFLPASLNKLPLAIIILKKVENEELSLDTKLPITDEDRDAYGGPLNDTPLTELSVKELLYYLLSWSDNTAFRVLEKESNPRELEILSLYLNFYVNVPDANTTIDPSEYQVSPKSVGNLFSSLYFSTILSPEHSELLLSLLSNATLDAHKYANLPPDVVVARKFGAYFSDRRNDFRDCGIMYIKDSRIFYCIMTENLNEKDSIAITGSIINGIYKYVTDLRKMNNLNI